MGKSSVFRKFTANLENDLVVSFNLEKQMTLTDFAISLIDNLETKHNKSVSLKKTLIQRVKDTPRNLVTSKLNATIDLSGFKVEMTSKSRNPLVAINLVLDSLSSIGENYCFIQIDDAGLLTEQMLRLLCTISEREKPAIGLMLAGESNLIQILVKKYNQFSHLIKRLVVELDTFEYEQTKKALLDPIKGSNIIWEEEAIALLHRFSKGVPYNIMLIAEETFWMLKENNTITPNSVRKAVKECLSEFISEQTVLFRSEDNTRIYLTVCVFRLIRV